MVQYKCDFCGKVYENNNNVREIKKIESFSIAKIICDDCLKKLTD